MSLLAKRLGLALALVLASQPALAVNPTERLGLCGITFREFSGNYSKRAPNGELTAQEAVDKGFVMSEAHGLVRVKRYDAESGDLTVEYARKGRISSTNFVQVPREKLGRFARLGSSEAREILELRTKKHFERPERFPYFFAMKGIHSIVGSAAKGTERYEVMNEVWKATRSQFPELADLDFNRILEKWREMFPSENLSGPPHNPEQQEMLNSVLDTFVREYHRRTGLNLVKAGVIASSQAFWGHGTAAWRSPFMDSVDGLSIWNATKRSYLGGVMSDVPMDIALHAMATSWHEADIKFPLAPRDLFSTEYVPGGKDTDLHSNLLLEFKNTGDIRTAMPLLEPASRSPRFAAFRDAIPAGSLVVAVPSASRENKSGQALGTWLTEKIPGTRYLPDGLKATGSTPQKYKDNVLDRLANIQGIDVTVHGSVRGKVVVLVDDVVASGATTERMKQELLKAGATAVHVFSAAKSGEKPELSITAGLVNLPPPITVTRTLPLTSISNQEFIQLMVYPLPWAGKKVKDIEEADRKIKNRFEKAFKESDVTTLFGLPAEQLDQLDEKGRPTAKPGVGSLSRAIESDEGLLVAYLNNLYASRTQPNFEEIKTSPLAHAVLNSAKSKLTQGPFTNRAGSNLLEWLRTQ